MGGLTLIAILLFSANLVFAKDTCKDFSNKWYYTKDGEIAVSARGEIESIEVDNVVDVHFYEDAKYLKASFKNGKIVIELRDEFKNFEENESYFYIEDDLVIKCEGDKYENEVRYRVNLKKENNHAPVFTQKEYSYSLYGYLPKYFTLTELLPIEAKDIDIGTYGLKFEIEDNEYFQASSVTIGKKVESFKLSLKEGINGPLTIKLKITARDSGYAESKSADSYISINLQENDEEIKFAEKEFTGKIYNRDLFVLDNPIKIEGGVDSSIKITLQSNYTDYFKTYVDYINEGIGISLIKRLPAPTTRSNDLDHLDMRLDISWHGKNASTDIKATVGDDKNIGKLCKISGIDLSRSSYRNPEEIEDTKTGVIKTFDDTLNVEDVTCTDSKYMTCKYENNVLSFELTEEFKNYQANEISYDMSTRMTISCPYEKVGMDFIQKIKDVNTHKPIFDKDTYDYVLYNRIPKGFRLTNILPITVTDGDLGTRFEVSMTENENVSIGFSETHQQHALVALSTKKQLDVGFDETYTLTIKDKDFENTATFKIKVLENRDDFGFTRSTYVAKKTDGQFVMETPIAFIDGFDTKTTITLDAQNFTKHFEIKTSFVDNGIVLKNTKPIVDTRDTVIPITVEAEWNGLTSKTIVNYYISGDLAVLVDKHLDGFSTFVFRMTLAAGILTGIISFCLLGVNYVIWKFAFSIKSED